MPIDKTDDREHGFSLTLMTQNTWGVPLVAPHRKERYSKLFANMKKLPADVYTLQETFSPRITKEQLTDPWQKQVSPYFASGDGAIPKKFKFGTSGLTTLSRVKIVRHEFLSFKAASFPDCFANKGVLLTTLRLPSGQLVDLYQSHPQADQTLNPDGRKPRLKQMVQFKQFIKENSPADRTVLIAGDLNIQENGPEYNLLVDADGILDPGDDRFIDVSREIYTDPTIDPLVTFRRTKPEQEQRLDYIFVRPGEGLDWDKASSSVRVLDMQVSDHNGLYATLNFVDK